MSSPHFDVVVVGAGPAGCAVARVLAGLSHRVLLVNRPGGQTQNLAESIPPSAKKVLGALGMLTAMEDAGFQPWLGNTVWWANRPPRVEPFAPGAAGYQVLRRDLDARLVALARQTGADVRTGLVRDVVEPSGADSASTWSVTLDTGATALRVTASFLIDASGRAGVLARRGLRRTIAAPNTVALAGLWHAPSPAGFPGAEQSHTLVASYEDGWAWSVATSAELRQATVMVDPKRTALARGAPATSVYLAELQKVGPFASVLAGAELTGGPWGADASPYDAVRYAGPGFLVVGDAGSFIDPLSSFGVKKAWASAWLGGIAAHTALTKPAMRTVALDFFERREREVAAAAQRQAARFASEAAADSGHAFWLARVAVDEEPATADAWADPGTLAKDPEVLAAFADLRVRPSIRLARGERAAIEPRAAIRGTEIALDDHVVLAEWPDGLRYLRNVDLVGLLQLAPVHQDVGALFETYVARYVPVPLPDFLGALAVLLARGALKHDQLGSGQ